MTEMSDTLKGEGFPFGSSVTPKGANFAVFSKNAEKVELCLFNRQGDETRIPMYRTDDVWHIFVKGIKSGQLYGYRAYGMYSPYDGKKFNPHKLLLDPYSKKTYGESVWHNSMHAYQDEHNITVLNKTDDAAFMPKSVVVGDTSDFDWRNDKLPRISLYKTILYELNVKGMTATLPSVPQKLRGTFLGLASDSCLTYLKSLGVTSLNIMPVQNFFTNTIQKNNGLSNYWGYDSLCFFAPENKYSVSCGINEFKTLVKACHKQGLEVILDVVFNHTTESNHLGPTLCFKGLDNEVYYRPNPIDKNRYIDDTGCGASFNFDSDIVRKLVIDALTYWAKEMHVDGFRFDLAVTLAREKGRFNPDCVFLKELLNNPILNRLKLIAEPWDLGSEGYQLGNFPPCFMEWNDKYRDTIRRFWRGDKGLTSSVASCVTGSHALFGNKQDLWASVNFITAHDGFTLYDLVSYNKKHNEANGENNQDGSDANFSFNGGEEGETSSVQINKLRQNRMAAMLATLLISAGTPMLLYGDEFARSQQGNNNAYCQDNPLTWIDWKNNKDYQDNPFWHFIGKLISFRIKSTVINNPAARYKYFTPLGQEMNDEDWHKDFARSLSFTVAAEDKELFIIMNAFDAGIKWILPPLSNKKGGWKLRFDSDTLFCGNKSKKFADYTVPQFSVVIFESTV